MVIVNYLGGFLAFVVALVLGVYARRGIRKATYFLMGYLLTLSITSILGTMYLTGDLLYVPALYRVESPFHYLVGPFFSLYIKTSIYRNYRLKTWEWLFFLPAVLNFIEFMPHYAQSNADKAEQIRLILDGQKGLAMPHFHPVAKIASSFVFYVGSVWLVVRYLENGRKYKLEQNVVFNRWLITLLLIAGVYYLMRLVRILFPDFIIIDLFIFDRIVISCMCMAFGLFLLLYPQILYGALFEAPEKEVIRSESAPPIVKYKYSTLTQEQKDAYYQQLQRFMQTEKPYLNKKVTLQEMAYKLDISPQHLSQVFWITLIFTGLPMPSNYWIRAG
jgi:hypothetical protein